MQKMTLKNKARYKIWKHMKKKLNQKIGKLASSVTYLDKLRYKVFKNLSKKLSKKNLIPDVSADLKKFKEYVSGMKECLPFSTEKGEILKQKINTVENKLINLREEVVRLNAEKNSDFNEVSKKIVAEVTKVNVDVQEIKTLEKNNFLFNLLPQKYKNIFYLRKITPSENDVRKICLESHYNDVLNGIRKRVVLGEKVKICFLGLGNNCPWSLVEVLNKDSLFDVTVILTNSFQSTRKEVIDYSLLLKDKYSKLYPDIKFVSPLEKEDDELFDISGFDIIYHANPYSDFWPEQYKLPYLSTKNCLLIFSNYGYFLSSYAFYLLQSQPDVQCYWRIFAENDEIKSIIDEKSVLLDSRAVVTGYVRTDCLIDIKKEDRKRKKIIIATHSTSKIRPHGIEFACFPIFAEALLHLPEKYPDIDFIFRPHALQWKYLLEDESWTQEQVNAYINKMNSYPNVIYQRHDIDFYEDFVNSDGLIHDCGSFTAEYLFTENPACYLCDKNKDYHSIFTKVGYQCFDKHYHAFNEKDLDDFVQMVIHGENEQKRQERISFVNNVLKINYGHVGEKIAQYLKDEILL